VKKEPTHPLPTHSSKYILKLQIKYTFSTYKLFLEKMCNNYDNSVKGIDQVLTNEKTGGLKVVPIDRSFFVENLNVNSFKQDRTIETTYNPPLFSFDNIFKETVVHSIFLNFQFSYIYPVYAVYDSTIYPRSTVLSALCIFMYLSVV
jgi:hypothetical protein